MKIYLFHKTFRTQLKGNSAYEVFQPHIHSNQNDGRKNLQKSKNQVAEMEEKNLQKWQQKLAEAAKICSNSIKRPAEMAATTRKMLL